MTETDATAPSETPGVDLRSDTVTRPTPAMYERMRHAPLGDDGLDGDPTARELEALALKTGQTQLFIETPYRNAALLQALVQTLQHNTRLAVARGLTLAEANLRSETIKGWRANKPPAGVDERLPAVFAIGR